MDNPPFGPKGAAHIYAAQKGASEEDIALLDDGILHLCNQILVDSGRDLNSLKGGGAAGGGGAQGARGQGLGIPSLGIFEILKHSANFELPEHENILSFFL